MKYLLLRSLPLLTAAIVGILSWWQFVYWEWYPWLWLATFVCATMSALAIGYRRIAFREWLKMVPIFLVYLVSGGASLLVERGVQQWCMVGVSIALVYLSLELLFLLGHKPSEYPVHGLSRFNIAIIPLGAGFLALSLSGFQVFLESPPWFAPLVCVVYSTVMFYATSHHASDHEQDRRWLWFGALVGIHMGILTMILPLDVIATGVVAALVIALPLRARRYTHDPKPPRRQAWIESGLYVSCLLAVFLFSRWA